MKKAWSSKHNWLENAPLNLKGTRKVLNVPIGVEAVKKFKKKHSKAPWISKRRQKHPIHVATQYARSDCTDAHAQKLVYHSVQANLNRGASCILRDSYKIGQLIGMLKDLWLSSHRTSIREMVCLSCRHNMLLRGEDLRHLNFSDCFSTAIPKRQHRGEQEATGLIFCIDKEKTLKQGENNYSCAMRQENIYRCWFQNWLWVVPKNWWMLMSTRWALSGFLIKTYCTMFTSRHQRGNK